MDDAGLGAEAFSALAFLAGAWLVVSPLVLDRPPVAGTNDVVVGVLLIVFAAVSMVLGRRARRSSHR